MRALVLLALLVPASAGALPRWSTYLRVGAQWVTDPSFDLVSGVDAMPRVELGLGWQASDALAFELGYGLASASATSFQTVDSQLTLHQFEASAVGRLPLTRSLRLIGRGGAGVELAHLSLSQTDSTVDGYGDTSTGLLLEATGGAELAFPLSMGEDPWGTRLQFSAEAGYGFRPFAARFDDLTRSGDGIRQGAVEVGTLDLSGPVLRFGAALWF